jgi:hypothetical protein
MGRRIVDLRDVLTRLLRIYDCHAAASGLLLPSPLGVSTGH